MSELRQRGSTTAGVTMNTDEAEDDKKYENLLNQGAGLSAKLMIDSSPQQHGVVLKLHVPMLFRLLPAALQRWVMTVSCLKFLAPSWKQRYLILCGSYIYKFKTNQSKVPKGSPFLLDNLDIRQEPGGDHLPELGYLPPGYDAVFSVSTLRRTHYYAVIDRHEAATWTRSLREAKQESITRRLGHAKHVPYPKVWEYFDNLGENLIKSKERIQERMERDRMKELEMSNFVEGAPGARSYYT